MVGPRKTVIKVEQSKHVHCDKIWNNRGDKNVT